MTESVKAEAVEIRYLDIPGRELADNGLPEIDEIIYQDMHLETDDEDHAYMTLPGWRVAIWASVADGDPVLSITAEREDYDDTASETNLHTALAAGAALLAAWEAHRAAAHTSLSLGPCAPCQEADAAITAYRETVARIARTEDS